MSVRKINYTTQRGVCAPFFVAALEQSAPQQLPDASETRVCFFFFFCWADMFVSFCLQKSLGNYKTATPNTKIKYKTKEEKQSFLYWRIGVKALNF